MLNDDREWCKTKIERSSWSNEHLKTMADLKQAIEIVILCVVVLAITLFASVDAQTSSSGSSSSSSTSGNFSSTPTFSHDIIYFKINRVFW